MPAASSRRSASAWIRPLGLLPSESWEVRRSRSRPSCIGSRYWLFLRTSLLPLRWRTGSCARRLSRAEKLQNSSKFVQPLNTDLRRSKRHASTVAFVEHPIRNLAAKPTALLCVDAFQILAASERRDLKRPPKERMPRIRNFRASKTVCRMSRVGFGDRGRRTNDR